MTLKIIGTFDRGKPYLERVLFEATIALNLAYFVVLHTKRLGAGVASGGHPAFWFPTAQVVTGQRVQLFTGARLAATPETGFNYYWGLPQTTLLTPDDCVVVIQATTWQSALEPAGLSSALGGGFGGPNTIGGLPGLPGGVAGPGGLSKLSDIAKFGGLGGPGNKLK